MIAHAGWPALPARLLFGLAALTLLGMLIGAAAGMVGVAAGEPSSSGAAFAAGWLALAALLSVIAARASLPLAVAICVAAALALRLSAYFAMADLAGVDTGNDYAAYRILADNLLEGSGFLTTTENYGPVIGMYPPLYPILLAGTGSLFGVHPAGILILNTFLDLGSAGLMLAIAWRLRETRAGLIAACLYLIWPSFVLEAPLAHKEGLMALLTLAMAWFTLRVLQRGPGWTSAAGFGLSAALLALCQPALLTLCVLFALLMVPALGARGLAIFALSAFPFWLAAMLPWWIRNWLVFDAFVPLTTSLGPSMMFAARGSRHLALDPGMTALAEPVRSSILASRAWALIVADPLAFLVTRATAVIRCLSIEDNAASRLTGFTPPYVWAKSMFAVTQLSYLGAVALALRQLCTAGATEGARAVALLLGVSLLQVLLVQLWLELAERHRYFMTPFLLMLAGLALARVLADRRDASRSPA